MGMKRMENFFMDEIFTIISLTSFILTMDLTLDINMMN